MATPRARRRKTVGVAFGSGGIRGIAHIGVLKSLHEHGISIDCIAGSSVGAWIGAHYALYRDIALLEELTVGNKREKLNSLFEISLRGGLVKGERVKRLVERWLGDSDFESAHVPIRIVACDLVTGEQTVFSSGKLATAVRASLSVPSIFAPFMHDGRALVDGGIVNPVPADVARGMGADVVIAVNLDNFVRGDVFTPHDSASIPRVTNRSVDLLRHYLAQRCSAHADVVIEPLNTRDELSNWKNYFLTDLGMEHIRLWMAAAEEKMPEILRLL